MRFEAAVKLESEVEAAVLNKNWDEGYAVFKLVLVGIKIFKAQKFFIGKTYLNVFKSQLFQ